MITTGGAPPLLVATEESAVTGACPSNSTVSPDLNCIPASSFSPASAGTVSSRVIAGSPAWIVTVVSFNTSLVPGRVMTIRTRSSGRPASARDLSAPCAFAGYEGASAKLARIGEPATGAVPKSTQVARKTALARPAKARAGLAKSLRRFTLRSSEVNLDENDASPWATAAPTIERQPIAVGAGPHTRRRLVNSAGL